MVLANSIRNYVISFTVATSSVYQTSTNVATLCTTTAGSEYITPQVDQKEQKKMGFDRERREQAGIRS